MNMKQRGANLALVTLFALVACQTVSQRDATGAARSEKQTSQPQSDIVAKVVQDMRETELAFLKHNCAKALEHGAKASATSGGNLTPFAALSYKVCAAEIDPKNPEKAQAALAVIAEIEKDAPRPFYAAYLEHLKGSRYLALGDRQNALKAKRRQREILHEQVYQLMQIDMQLLELSDAASGLTPGESSKFRKIGELAQRDETLFEALRQLDELMEAVKNPEAKGLILEQRAYVVARIEQLFSLDASLLEQRKVHGSETEVNAMAAELKQKYPTKYYEQRIDGIVAGSVQAQPKTAATPLSAQPAATPGTEAPLSDEQKVEKALVEARAALDSGNPAKAVDVLDDVPENLRNDKVKRARKDAMEVDVRQLRARVRDLYTRAKSQAKPAKLETLNQCKQILEGILSRYPETSVKSAVERNLRSINDEITEVGKAN